jgi:hypothetical protein
VTPCILVDGYQRIGGTSSGQKKYTQNIRGTLYRKIMKKERKKTEICALLEE